MDIKELEVYELKVLELEVTLPASVVREREASAMDLFAFQELKYERLL